MPFYRYECEDCGTEFRVLHRTDDGQDDLVKCPNCGGKRAKRLLPRIGVIYKGSGYYSTDYRSKKQRVAKPSNDGDGAAAKEGGDGVAATTTTKANQAED